MKPLVLGLGNELLSDDAVGIIAVREICREDPERADFIECSISGIALIDIMSGYQQAILVDAVHTGKYPAGTVIDLDPDELRLVRSPSPHYAGLPELMALARELNLDYPTDVRIKHFAHGCMQYFFP